MDIRRQVAYSENARRLLRETLTSHRETVSQPFETSGCYKTIGQLIAHMIGAERRWTLERLYGETRPARYEDQSAETLEGLFNDWDTIRERTLAFTAQADSAALGRVIAVELPQWNHVLQLTAEEVVLHICNHQTWHLGQISMALQQQGIEPPNFDYILLKEETIQEKIGTFVVNVEAVIYNGDRYLMAFRSEQESHAGGTLAFAGGKVEHTDTAEVLEETLRREIREEIAVEVEDFVYVESHSFGHTSPCVDVVFLCRYVRGIPRAVDAAEVSAVQWMTLAEVLAHPKTPPWIARSLTQAEKKRTQ